MPPPVSVPLATLPTRVSDRIPNPTYLDSRAIRIDTRSLAVFRIACGLLVIADVLLRSRNFTFFYTESGVVPQSVAMALSAENAFSVYHVTTDPTLIAALFVVTALVALQLVVGYRTWLVTVLTFLLVVSLDHHNPLVLSYADVLFRLLLFWAIFLPLGERWSIDALRTDSSPRTGVASIASGAILAQIVYMYVANGYHKTESALWTGGEATPLIMGLDNTTFLLDISSRLLDVNDTSVVEPRSLDQREKVVVEGHQNPVVVQSNGEVFSVGITQPFLGASCMYGPATTTQPVSDRYPDTLVAVQRSHASAASAERKSSM